MHIFKIIMLLLLLLSPLLANKSSQQILIAKTSHKKRLSAIYSKIHALHIAIVIRKRKSYYLIYSKKYTHFKRLKRDLKKLKRYFPSAIVVKTTKKIKKSLPPITKKRAQTPQKSRLSPDSFGAINVGYNSISGKTNNLLASKIDNAALSYSFEIGHFYTKNIFVTASYINSSTDDISLNTLTTSLNYTMRIDKEMEVYGGLIVGVDRVSMHAYTNDTSYALALGGQVGILYDIYKNTKLFTTYQGISINNSLKIDNSTIQFSFIHNVVFGISYAFNFKKLFYSN